MVKREKYTLGIKNLMVTQNLGVRIQQRAQQIAPGSRGG